LIISMKCEFNNW